MTEARMDGSPEQQLLWRVEALREGLRDVLTMADLAAAKAVAENALDGDDHNASVMAETTDAG